MKIVEFKDSNSSTKVTVRRGPEDKDRLRAAHVVIKALCGDEDDSFTVEERILADRSECVVRGNGPRKSSKKPSKEHKSKIAKAFEDLGFTANGEDDE